MRVEPHTAQKLYTCISTGWHNWLNTRSQACGQVQVILLEDCYVQFRSPSGCLSELWY